MKRFLVAVILVAALYLPIFARGSDQGSRDDRAAVVAAETRFFQAYVSHDTSSLEQLMADTLSFTKENGFVSDKPTEVRLQGELAQRAGRAAATTDGKRAPMNYQSRAVQVYGNTAVTTGSFEESELNGASVRFHFTNTWVTRNDAWQVVAIQITTVSESVLRNLERMPKPR